MFNIFYVSFNFIVLLLTAVASNAAELYSERPDILDVVAQEHVRDSTWNKLKIGHLEAVAQILSLYPDQEIFFLARDGELLYDLVRILSHSLRDKKDLDRTHLINISRLSKSSPHLRAYLEQEGLKEENLLKGKKVLLVDTGFEGSIPKAIQQVYPPEVRELIQTQLMCSANVCHPSSRVFLLSLNGVAADVHPTTLHGSIISYEHRPRYTQRADRYVEVNGQWVPAAPHDGSTSDGLVSRAEALKDMADLKAFGLKTDVQKKFLKRKLFWRALHGHIVAKDKAKILEMLNTDWLTKHRKRPAIVRDALDIMGTNLAANDPQLDEYWPDFHEVGLEPIDDTKRFGNKKDIIQAYPRWKPFIEDPNTGIWTLIKAGDFHTLGAIADVLQDAEFDKVLAIRFAKSAQNPNFGIQLREIARALIENGDASKRRALIENTFISPKVVDWKKELSLLIPYCDWEDACRLIHVFAQPHAADWAFQLGELIQRSSKDLQRHLAREVFSQEHAHHFKKEFALIVDRHPDIFQDLTFSIGILNKNFLTIFRPHFKLLIQNSDQVVRYCIAHIIAHIAALSDLCNEELCLLIVVADQKVKEKLAERAFSKDLATGRRDALQLLVQKGSPEVDLILLAKAFNGLHAQEWVWELFIILTRADSEQWSKIVACMEQFRVEKYQNTSRRRVIFEKYHPFKNIIVTASAITDFKEREKYLRKALGVTGDIKAQKSLYGRKGVFYSGKIWNGLNEVQQKLQKQWLKQGIIDNKKSMAVIVDVDKTLVLSKQNSLDPYQERPGATEFLRALERAGVLVLVSSAHEDFSKTIKKLLDIGAFSYLPAHQGDTEPKVLDVEIKLKNIYDQEESRVSLELYELGSVVSAKLKDKDVNFQRKAYSLLSLPQAVRNNIKQVFLVDDSVSIIRSFIKDIQEFAPNYLPALERAKIYQIASESLVTD